MKKHLILYLVVIVVMLIAAPAFALDVVTLQLKWMHAFQFAGYYAAQEKGYYREAGIDVHIKEILPGMDVIGEVVSGNAQFGIGESGLLIDRKNGRPVVVLAVIFQHSPLVLVAREWNPAQTIHDLVGKRVMLESQADELMAYLKQEGITSDLFTLIGHSFDLQDLIDGSVDAISAYSTNEIYYLDHAEFPYRIYTPRSVGIDFYGDNLFTSEDELKNHPDRVDAFRKASLRGWEYAVTHPEEIIDLILTKYSQRNPRDFYEFEVKQIISLIRPDLIEIGYMNPGRWRNIADIYADTGMLPRGFSLDGFLYPIKK